MIVISILSVILTILGFIASIPVRSSIFLVKANIKRMERKESKKSKGREVKNNLLKNVKYKAQKILLMSLRLLLMLIKCISHITLIITIFIIIIVVIVLFVLIGVIASIATVVMDGKLGLTSTGGTSKNTTSTKTEVVADVDGWLKACQTVWTYNKKKGWNYSQIKTYNDKNYGLVRPDCSGYTWQCLSEFGSVKKPFRGVIPYSGNFVSSCKGLKDWDVLNYTKSSKLKKGDILVRPKDLGHGHVTIYAGNGRYFNNGSSSTSFPSRDGATKKGTYDFWGSYMTKGCYIIRLKGSSKATKSLGSSKEDKKEVKGTADAEKFLSATKIAWGASKDLNVVYGDHWTVKIPGYGTGRADCSGMVGSTLYIAGFGGESIRATTSPSYSYWEGNAYINKLIKKGKMKRISVSPSSWSINKFNKGDIVIYPGHVNIYAGNEKWYDGGTTNVLRHSPAKYNWKRKCGGENLKILRWLE